MYMLILFLGLALRHQGWQLRLVPLRLRREDVTAGHPAGDEDHCQSDEVQNKMFGFKLSLVNR